MLKSKITIKDIAKLLNISKSTVSRALKDHPDISDKTKKRVKNLAKTFNYQPNQLAISLRSNKSKLIGLILPEIYNYFFPSVIKGIEDIVRQKGYNLIILQSNESFKTEVKNINFLIDNNVEGMLVCISRETTDLKYFQEVIDSNIPLVFLDRVPKDIKASMVLLDDISGAYKATAHLIQKGRKRIAICIGKPELLISSNRLLGYKNALKDHKLPFYDAYVISGKTPEEAKIKALELFSLKNPPDSILTISDLTMSGVMQAIYLKNFKVPEELSVVGFCEDTFCKMYNPSVSSINPMGKEIGNKAAEIVFEQINSNNPSSIKTKVLIPGKLVVRDST